MDFWSTAYAASASSIDTLLEKDNCTIEELFEDQHYLLELKSNEKLMEYITKEESMNKCLEYICTSTDTTLSGMAAQTFAIEVPMIQNKVFEMNNIISTLISTFIKEKNPIILNNIVTVFTALQRVKEFKDIVVGNEEFVNNLFDEMNNAIKVNYLIVLIQSNILVENVMKRFIEMITKEQFTENIAMILFQIIDWELPIATKMMNDFITTENIDSFFEYVTKAKGNNLELTLQIIRLLLPLHISIEVNQSQFLESLKKNIVSIVQLIDFESKKITMNTIYIQHILNYCLKYNKETINELSTSGLMEKFIELYLNIEMNSSIYRHYINDMISLYVEYHQEQMKTLIESTQLLTKLQENDKQTSEYHYKYDSFMFGQKLFYGYLK